MGPSPQPRRTSRLSVRLAAALCLLAVAVLGVARAEAGSTLSVNITSAPPSTTTSTSATIAFAASGAKKTTCRLDSASFAACTSPVSYTGLSVGTHTFVVKATGSGNRVVSASTSWEVVSSSTSAFSVTSSVANGATLSGSVEWTATTSATASQVDFYIDGALRWTEHYTPYVFNGDPGGMLDTKTLADGSHVLKVVATTGSATAQTSVTVQVANGTSSTPFTVASSIATGSSLSGSVSWQATTSQTASQVDFYIDGSLAWTERASPYVFNGDGNTLDTATLTDGSHALKIVATASSNGATASFSATVQVANGSTVALTVGSSISDGATLSGAVTWTASPSESVSGVGFYVDGALRYTDNAAPYRFNGDAGTLDTTTLTNGSHGLGIVATAPDSSTAQASATVQVSNVTPAPAPTPTGGAGDVRFSELTSSSMTSYTNSPTTSQQQWMRDHWQRAVVFSSYWDTRLSWFPNGWAYIDAYAIYRTSSLATQHPDWILKDAAGNKLYIPYGCSGGVCPQYAADIGSSAWRQYFIGQAQTLLALGYKGIYIDDVDMDRNVGNGSGQQVAPIDPRTGAEMSDAAWKTYFAQFMEQVRAAFPGVEIVHNAVWFTGGGQHDGTQPEIAREIAAASYYHMERGFNDPGLTGGTGIWSVYAMMRFIDNAHAKGTHVVLQSYASDATGAEYNLAGYFLVSDGGDYVSSSYGSLPGSWWSGFDTNLGDAKGARYLWNGVWRRDFTNGFVLMNEPGASTKTLSLGGTYTTVSGSQVSSVTLGAARGAVLKS
jgi:putative glycosyl hydrolase-like family 15 (GHL15) protein/Big-like domain-containing protein